MKRVSENGNAVSYDSPGLAVRPTLGKDVAIRSSTPTGVASGFTRSLPDVAFIIGYPVFIEKGAILLLLLDVVVQKWEAIFRGENHMHYEIGEGLGHDPIMPAGEPEATHVGVAD